MRVEVHDYSRHQPLNWIDRMMQGQGKPLPSFMQLDGEWIIENQLFLHHSGNSDASDFTRVAERLDGTFAIGFDSSQLAAALGVDVASLIAANHTGELELVGISKERPAHGGGSARLYSFRKGDRKACLVVEVYQQEGRA